MRGRRTLILAVGGLIVVGLFVALRPDDRGATARATTADETTVTATAAATTAPVETEPSTKTARKQSSGAMPVEVTITVRGGKAVGGITRATLEKGAPVVLVVRADVADHVHLHGYDVMREVAPGAPARLAFRADLVGVFEVELEERKVPIAELEVRP